MLLKIYDAGLIYWMLFLNYLKLIKCVLRRNNIIALEVKDISYHTI